MKLPSQNRKINRRKCIAAMATMPVLGASAVVAKTSAPDPLVALCAEHELIYARYVELQDAHERGELTGHDFDDLADPILEDAFAVTDRICGAQATSMRGLELQYRHLIEHMAPDIHSGYCDTWAAIFDNMLAGFETVAATA